MKPVKIPPNKPIFVALIDPEGVYDFEQGCGYYQTTDGERLTLPRPAVVRLNELEPAPGEEIKILKIWSGRPKDKARWTIEFSQDPAAIASQEPATPAGRPKVPPETKQSHQERPMPIERPSRKQPTADSQPRLFDCAPQGNGTTGPARLPEPHAFIVNPEGKPFVMPARARGARPDQIPANVAVREILSFINIDPNTVNWGDQAKQDLASTIIIAAYRAGHIGLWERK